MGYGTEVRTPQERSGHHMAFFTGKVQKPCPGEARLGQNLWVPLLPAPALMQGLGQVGDEPWTLKIVKALVTSLPVKQSYQRFI